MRERQFSDEQIVAIFLGADVSGVNIFRFDPDRGRRDRPPRLAPPPQIRVNTPAERCESG